MSPRGTMGQMAPAPPVGRTQAIALVEAGRLPVWLGSPHPFVTIVEQDGRFRIRGLVVDMAESQAAAATAIANRQSFQPEHHYALGKPTGTIHVDAATRAELLETMRSMEWPPAW